MDWTYSESHQGVSVALRAAQEALRTDEARALASLVLGGGSGGWGSIFRACCLRILDWRHLQGA